MITLTIAYTSYFDYCETFGDLYYTVNGKLLTCPVPNSSYLSHTQKSPHESNGIILKRNTAITQYTHTPYAESSSSSSRRADSTQFDRSIFACDINDSINYSGQRINYSLDIHDIRSRLYQTSQRYK